jgi:hypothetical protein
MIERLSTLSRPVRYATYFVCVLLTFAIAIGIGATAAVVVGWQFGRAATESAGNGTAKGGMSETSGSDRAAEGTQVESSDDTKSPIDAVSQASFTHQAEDQNSRGDYTYISQSIIDGDANAVVIVSVSPPSGGESTVAASYEHNIGVWYEPGARRWAIFNQDRLPVPPGTTFEVNIPKESAAFVHLADSLNTASNYTYLDNRLTNGKPDAVLSVTPNWNPGGGTGVYNNHPVDTLYDRKLKKWAIINLDGTPISEGAAFNVAVSAGVEETAK